MSGIVGSKFNHRGSGLVASLGTDGQHMLSSGAGKKHVFETVTADTYDDEPIKSDIIALALREATNEASVAFNLTSSFIDTFTDDTNLGTQTTVDRDSVSGGGFVSSVYGAFGSQAAVAAGAGTAIGDFTNNGGLSAAFDENTSQGGGACAGKTSVHSGTAIPYLGKDWGSGNTRYMTGFVVVGSSDDGTHSASDQTSDCSLTLIGGNTSDPAAATAIGTLTGLNFRTNSTSHSKLDFTRPSVGHRYNWVYPSFKTATSGTATWAELTFHEDPITVSDNATGTLAQSANTVASSKTEVAGTMLYKDSVGTATIGTDLKIYFSCNNGTNWTEAASYNAITPVYSSGVKYVRLGKTTCTAGTGVIYKAVWANQSEDSKETHLLGIGTTY